jgi:hypothetical protein
MQYFYLILATIFSVPLAYGASSNIACLPVDIADGKVTIRSFCNAKTWNQKLNLKADFRTGCATAIQQAESELGSAFNYPQADFDISSQNIRLPDCAESEVLYIPCK